MGEGGGLGSSSGEVMSSFESCDGDVGPSRGESGASARLVFDIADRELLPDLIASS